MSVLWPKKLHMVIFGFDFTVNVYLDITKCGRMPSVHLYQDKCFILFLI